MKDTLCTGGGHSHHQFGVNLVGFHAIIFTVYSTHQKKESQTWDLFPDVVNDSFVQIDASRQ